MQTAAWFEPNSEAASPLGHRTQNPCNAVAIKDLNLLKRKQKWICSLGKKKKRKENGSQISIPRATEKGRESEREPEGPSGNNPWNLNTTCFLPCSSQPSDSTNSQGHSFVIGETGQIQGLKGRRNEGVHIKYLAQALAAGCSNISYYYCLENGTVLRRSSHQEEHGRH